MKQMKLKMSFFLLWLLMLSSKINSQNFMPKNITGLECTSSLHIVDFESGKKKKVVVNKEIDYRAKPDNGDPTWNWQLGSGNCSTFAPFWTIQPLNSSFMAKKNKGAKITNMPLNNSDFGETNGQVRVNNSTETSCLDSKGHDYKVKVFFEKDATNNPDGTVPNWFYYWGQIPLIQSYLSNPAGFKLYDRPKCKFNNNNSPVNLSLVYAGVKYPFNSSGNSTFGNCNFNVKNMPKEDLFSFIPPSCIPMGSNHDEAIVSYGNNQIIEIGEGCGFTKAKDICNLNLGNTEGIHVFYSTVVHEVEHAVIESEVWSYTNSSAPSVDGGYLLSYDMDKDGYKDIWEQFVGFAFGFATGTDDSYSSTYASCFCSGTCSKGSMYEETRCRNKEQSLNLSQIDLFDWSFDPSNTVQGKQW